MKAAELYEIDFAEWTRWNAELLRSGRASEADLEHIAEEIEDMGKRERRSLLHHSTRLIEHLLKWEYQPERGASWQRTIVVQRQDIVELLEENPSFRAILAKLVEKAYRNAVTIVAKVIKRSQTEFPAECPYTIEQLLNQDFLP
jgi:formate dehydrogenase maturation protein FdhE